MLTVYFCLSLCKVMSIFLHWVEGYCWHCCTLKALLCLLWSKLFLWSHVVTNCSVEIFQNECIWFLRSREHHVSVCARVCHSSSAYFHGYSKTGWSMKACLLQTSWCALITALCASYPAVMGGEMDRESVTTKQSLWEKRCMYGSKNTARSGAQGNEERVRDGEWMEDCCRASHQRHSA